MRGDGKAEGAAAKRGARAMKQMTKQEVEAFFRAVREASVAPIVLWLENHYEEMHALTDERRVSWPALVQRLDALGIRNRNGTPLRPPTVRGTWARVRRRMKEEAEVVS